MAGPHPGRAMLGLKRSPKVLAGDADYGVTVAVSAVDEEAVRAVFNVTPALRKWTKGGGSWKRWRGVTITKHRVTELDLARSRIKGLIPLSLGRMSGLTGLYLNGNRLHGAIPKEICLMVNLRRLWLQANLLHGAIPPEIGRLLLLKQLWLHQNRLEGPIPPEVAGLKEVEQLWLYQNELGGELPLVVGRFRTERGASVLLKRNRPFALAADVRPVRDVQVLDLSHSGLHGAIPDAFGELSRVRELRLNDNRLGGALPIKLGVLKANGCAIDLANNLGFVLADDCAPAAKTPILDLSNLCLHGRVPAALGRLSRLVSLDLSANALTELPAAILELKLRTFTVEGNKTLVKPPLNIAEKGLPYIKRYFAQLARVGVDHPETDPLERPATANTLDVGWYDSTL